MSVEEDLVELVEGTPGPPAPLPVFEEFRFEKTMRRNPFDRSALWNFWAPSGAVIQLDRRSTGWYAKCGVDTENREETRAWWGAWLDHNPSRDFSTRGELAEAVCQIYVREVWPRRPDVSEDLIAQIEETSSESDELSPPQLEQFQLKKVWMRGNAPSAMWNFQAPSGAVVQLMAEREGWVARYGQNWRTQQETSYWWEGWLKHRPQNEFPTRRALTQALYRVYLDHVFGASEEEECS